MSSTPPTPDPVRLQAEAVLSVQQAERRRIAQLFHDTISQSLTGAYLQAVVVAQKLQQAGAGKTEEVARLVDMIHQTVLEMRAITGQLASEERKSSDSVESS